MDASDVIQILLHLLTLSENAGCTTIDADRVGEPEEPIFWVRCCCCSQCEAEANAEETPRPEQDAKDDSKAKANDEGAVPEQEAKDVEYAKLLSKPMPTAATRGQVSEWLARDLAGAGLRANIVLIMCLY